MYNRRRVLTVPEGAEGFVYKIHYQDGSFYIGKKAFYSIRRMEVKGKSRKKVVKKESDWKEYRGSSVDARALAKAGKVVKLEVLHLCESRGCTLFLELYEHVIHDVLCNPKAVNKNIMLRIFKCYKRMEV